MSNRLLETPARVIGMVLGISLLARFLFAAGGIEVTADSVSYQISAMGLTNALWPEFTLENSGGYPLYLTPQLLEHNASDFLIERTPGYPVWMMLHLGILKVLYGLVTTDAFYRGLVLSNSLLGVLLALLSTELCWRIFGQKNLSLAVGLLVGLSPNLLGSEHVILSEPFYAVCLTGLLLMATRWPYAECSAHARIITLTMGIFSGWLLWVKPIGLVMVLAIVAFLWLNRARHQLPLFALPIVLMIALWMGFQYQVHGGFIGYTAGSGLNQLYKVVNFLDMDSPLHRGFKRELADWVRQAPPENAYISVNVVHVQHIQAELQKPPSSRRPIWRIYLEDDRQARDVAREAMLNNPAKYLQVTLQQIPRTWLGPTVWDKHLIYWGPVFLLGLLGMVLYYREQRQAGVGFLLLLTIAGNMLLYSLLTLGDSRYRAPLEPLFIIFAVFATHRLFEAHRQARQ